MSSFFYKLFLFCSKHRLLFLGGLTLFAVFFGYKTSQLKFNENISDIFPEDESLGYVQKVFNDSKLNSNLVVRFYQTDSSLSNTSLPDSMIRIGFLIDSCLYERHAESIAQRMLSYPDSLVTQVYDFFGDYLPIYLKDEDYNLIDQKLTEENINKTVLGNFKALISPIGIFGGKMVKKDPFGLTQIPLKHFQESQFDSNFQLYQNHLFSGDKRQMLYFIELANQANETDKNGALISFLNELILKYKVEGVEVEYFGAPAVAAANAERIKNDIILSVSLATVIILLLILFYFRNLTTFLLVLLPGFLGVLTVLGILVIIGHSISLISLGVGSIMVGITVDFALHILSHHRSEPSIKQLFQSIVQPILMSSFTTASAFLALVFINSNAMRDLGLFVGGSVLSASLFSLIVLPHFLPKIDLKGKEKQSVFADFFGKIVSVKLYRKKWAFVFFIAVTGISVFYGGEMNFNKDMMSLNYMPSHLQKAEESLNQVLESSGKELYILTSGTDFWEALEKNEVPIQELNKLKTEGKIKSFSSVNSFIPSLGNQNGRLEKWKSYWASKDTANLNRTVATAATRLGLNSKVYGGLKTYLTKDFSSIQSADVQKMLALAGEKFVIRSEEDVSLITVIKFDGDKKNEVLEALVKIKGGHVLDRSHITNKLIGILSKDFGKLINLSLLVVFGILLVVYGRIELALTTILPIAIGWLWTIGLMHLFNLSFNIVNIIICSLIFGLGVDYSIFNLRGLIEKYSYGRKNTTSFRVSIFLSGITTVTGIGVLAFAQHPALKSIALLAVIGISSVIFLTFFIQDVLFDFFVQRRKDKGFIPHTVFSFIFSMFAFFTFGIGCLLLVAVRALFFIPILPTLQKKAFHHLVMWYCRSLIYVMPNIRKNIIDKTNIDFQKPSIIISNHHSFLDILTLLMFNPKVVMVTNNWVYNSPFFGAVVRYAGFILSTEGVENQLAKAQKLVDGGYSIIIFPEGTRSATVDCGRFHKGAFYLADKLRLDIQPVILHGTHYLLPKKDPFYLRNGQLSAKFLPRIAHNDLSFGEGYKERTKKISTYFKEEYLKTREELETPSFFLHTIHNNYLFNSPIVEWYMRIKIMFEKNYELFHKLAPKEGTIVDIGCGYGFLGHALAFSSSARKIIGLDYDAKKIEQAANTPVKPTTLEFYHHDALTFDYPMAHTFLLNDVLHYLAPSEQNQLIELIYKKLEQGGQMIIRDGDHSKKKRHIGTVLTEIFSTKSGFNKSRNKLNYISTEWVENIAEKHGLSMEIIDNTKHTSNTIFILRKEFK